MDPMQRLLDIAIARCVTHRAAAWTSARPHATIAPYALEEACEVADAIERGDMDELRDLSSATCCSRWRSAARIARRGRFFADVAAGIFAKMIRHHPRVRRRRLRR